jgi:uncharacterized membrane protein YagU involved in acid resistance
VATVISDLIGAYWTPWKSIKETKNNWRWLWINQNVNIYKKAFIRAIFSAVVVVISVFVVRSHMKIAMPNLLVLGLILFAIYYLVELLLFRIKQKFSTK